MRVLVAADVGSAAGFHVGDEAMLEAAVLALRARGATDITVLSGDPSDTEARYGVEAVARVAFGDGFAVAMERAKAVCAAASGVSGALFSSDPAWVLVDSVLKADAVLIAGGGNLSSYWPGQILERWLLAKLAKMFDKPLVVSGQSFGPFSDDRHLELVQEIMTSADLVGVREHNSYAVARQLGVANASLATIVDDAVLLSSGYSTDALPPASSKTVSTPYVVASFAAFPGLADADSYPGVIAACLDEIADTTGLDVVLLPNQGKSVGGDQPGDSMLNQEISVEMSNRNVQQADVLEPAEFIGLVQRAAAVVSSRYHPIVFALAAGVPCVGVSIDEYTSNKIGGALDLYGMGSFLVPFLGLTSGEVAAAAKEGLERQVEIGHHLRGMGAARRDELDTWWDVVYAELSGTRHVSPAPAAPTRSLPVTSDWSTRAAAQSEWTRSLSQREMALRRALAHDVEIAALSAARISTLEGQLDLEASSNIELRAELELAEASHVAATDLVAELLSPIYSSIRPPRTTRSLQNELDALRRSRTFRYTIILRAAYSKMRRFIPRGNRSVVDLRDGKVKGHRKMLEREASDNG